MQLKRLSLLVGIVGFYEDSFLIIKRSRVCKFLPLNWTFPAGKLEIGVENINDAVLRELHEETGLEGTIMDILNVSEFTGIKESTFLHNVQLNFLVSLHNNMVLLNDEAESFDWFKLENYLDSPLNEYNKKIIESSYDKIKHRLTKGLPQVWRTE